MQEVGGGGALSSATRLGPGRQATRHVRARAGGAHVTTARDLSHLMKRSLLTGLDFLATPPLGCSVHISLTFSSTMLQCRSNALTRPSSFLLFLQLISTCVLLFTLCVSTDSGPVENSSSSLLALSSFAPAEARSLRAGTAEDGEVGAQADGAWGRPGWRRRECERRALASGAGVSRSVRHRAVLVSYGGRRDHQRNQLARCYKLVMCGE